MHSTPGSSGACSSGTGSSGTGSSGTGSSRWPNLSGPALAVVAHPDDESFGLGAVLAALTSNGSIVDVLCFTHGEASTLGAAGDLGETRRSELAAAASALGLRRVSLLDFPDGTLSTVPDEELDVAVERVIGDAALVVVLEPRGVTGHADHRAATATALRVAARRGLATLEWGLHPDVAAVLQVEFDAPFAGFDDPGVIDVEVDRTAQRAAIECHLTQSRDNPVLRRRLALQGPLERVRYQLAGSHPDPPAPRPPRVEAECAGPMPRAPRPAPP